MAIYRNIQIDYWQDGFILDLTPEEKYFYIYLLTNSKTSQCGIYELPKRIIETETGYNRESVEKLLERFESYGKIVYSNETKEIYVKNWLRHNKINSPKVKKCIENELSKIKNKSFINLFLQQCKAENYIINIDELTTNDEDNLNDTQIQVIEKNIKKQTGKGLATKKANINNKGNYNEEIDKYKILYEQNIGIINNLIETWLYELYKEIDYELFKHAIEIATNKGKMNKAYISGIIKKWRENNIKNINDLNNYEYKIKNRGGKNGEYKHKHSKSKYAKSLEDEDEGLYQKPTEEQLQTARREFEELTK